MIPSPFFRQQQENRKKNSIFSQFDDDDETDEESNDNSFYHNPYHSSGQMNYVNIPQEQYKNEHNYPTYLEQQQITNDTTNQSIDDQIHQKLILLQQRGKHLQSYQNKQYDYGYKNQILQTPHLSFISNVNNEKTEEQTEEEEKQQEKEDEDYGISAYYPGQYPNLDEHFDLASVVLWYRNVMQSVKKFM